MKKLGYNISVVVSEVASVELIEPPRHHGGDPSLNVHMKNGVLHTIKHDVYRSSIDVYALKRELEQEMRA
jgi:hypothetical protein